MAKAPYAHITKGSLLIASPDIGNELFHRCIILICEHSEAGSFGLILNKPLPIEAQEEVNIIEKLKHLNIAFSSGGPIQPGQMLIIHGNEAYEELSVKIADQLYVGGDLNLLQDAMGDPDHPEMRLIFGYTGWGPGQLEKEFLSGLWYLFPATRDLVFHKPIEKMWNHILKEMGGKYASLSTMPEDLSVN